MREYIYKKGWPSLTKIQNAAIKQLHTTDNNLILIAPTASGKTEAAFLPAISKCPDIKNKLKILYISPLIALINDQFKRVSEMCKDLDIAVTSWHSEASVSQKEKLVKKPSGILLITPESLEAMLISDKGRAEVLFKDIDFVIVDEIHGFLNTNRGLQLKSLLKRIDSYTNKTPTMLGLSATIGDKNYDLAKSFFLNGKTTNILLDRSRNDLDSNIDYIESEDVNEEIARKILEYSIGKSTLVFPNSRAKVEKLSYLLKKAVVEKGYDIRVFSHHSSISKLKRTEIETFAKTSRQDFIIVATSTLELGIDIGAVDQVIQVGSAASVLSLSQRLGRSGRRSLKSVIYQIATDKWDLLQALASLMLFKEGKLDKIDPVKKSYDIFAHQVISTLLEKNGLLIKDYYKLNQDLESFADISDEEFKILTKFLLEKNYLEEIDGEYIVGMEAEKLMTMGSFYNQFVSKKTYKVQSEKAILGEIELGENLRIADRIYLSGQVWKIESINHNSRKIKVSLSDKANARSFAGTGGFEISGEVRAKMEEILLNPVNLDKKIKAIIENLGKEIKDEAYHYVDHGGKTSFRTFRSTKINKTLALIINIKTKSLDYYVEDRSSTIIGPKIKKDFNLLKENSLSDSDIKDFLIENPRLIDEFISLNKFMVLVPNELKINYIIENVLDLDGANQYLQNL